MSQHEYFRVTIGGEVHAPGPDDTLVVLHRHEAHQDLDYFAFADHEAQEMITVLNAPESARWIAGICFQGSGLVVPRIKGRTFKERFGWSPEAMIIREKSEEDIQDQWVELEMNKDIYLGQLVIPHEDFDPRH